MQTKRKQRLRKTSKEMDKSFIEIRDRHIRRSNLTTVYFTLCVTPTVLLHYILVILIHTFCRSSFCSSATEPDCGCGSWCIPPLSSSRIPHLQCDMAACWWYSAHSSQTEGVLQWHTISPTGWGCYWQRGILLLCQQPARAISPW